LERVWLRGLGILGSDMNLKNLREQTGLTQGEVANVLGIDLQCISNWERDASPVPAKHFKTLARVLKTEPNDFVAHYTKRYETSLRKKSGVKP
jgi:transcriptional regulator with XRE-family HTH domain